MRGIDWWYHGSHCHCPWDFNAEGIVGKVAFEIIGPLSIESAILERGFQVAVAARHRRKGRRHSIPRHPCRDVNDAGSLESKLRGKRPINQAHAVDKAAVEFHPESCNSLGKQDTR